MKKQIIFICSFLIVANISLAIKPDSLKNKNLFFYACLSSNIGNGDARSNQNGKYAEDDAKHYDFARARFDLKTPAIGIGALRQFKRSFIKVDVSYLYAIKNIEKNYTGNSTDVYDYVFSNYTDSRTVFYSPEKYQAGTVFYKWDDHVRVDLKAHYFDISAIYGVNVYKDLHVILGIRSNKLFNYTYSGSINRNANVYKITGMTSPGNLKDSIIGQKTVVISNSGELEQKLSQNIRSNFYATFGINYKFSLFDQLFMAEATYDLNLPLQSFNRRDYFSLKLNWMFKGI